MNAVQGQERLRSALRLLVAMAGLVIYLGDPSEHPARRPFAQTVLLLFVAYSVAMYLLAARRARYIPTRAAPWIDMAWVTLLVAVSEGTSSIFYPLYLFAILYASFGQGFRSGLAVALTSVASYALVGALTAPPGAVDRSDFVVRPLYLLVLGYLTAVWGGHEVRSRERLRLLREVTSLSSPRFGIDRTVARLLEALRAFHGADSCRLIVSDERTGERWMRTARADAATAEQVPLPVEMARVLLPSSPRGAFLVRVRRRLGGRRDVEMEPVDPAGPSRASGDPTLAASLVDALEAGALLSVPFRFHASAPGRLYVIRRAAHAFERGEAEFLGHVLDQVAPVLENVRLVDRLASDAADEERRRIARDLHDSVIQPYLGLRLGLSAARSAIAAGRVEEGTTHLDRLVHLADGEIQTLRGYVRELRTGEAASDGAPLDASVRRFCSRFAEATGIRVDVATEGPPVRNDRLVAEVFQMVAEGLSNVRRHTSAEHAEIRIRSADGRLHLAITNDAAVPGAPEFTPRSLRERAAALGGSLRVEHPGGGVTTVHVDVPL